MSSRHTLEALTARVDGELQGDPGHEITGVSDLKTAQAVHISFLGNPKYEAQAHSTQAGAVLIGRDQPADGIPCATIRVDNPSWAFAQVAELFAPPPIEYAPGVHPTAVVAEGVELGEGVSIGPHSVLEPGVRVGARSVIGAGAYLGHDSTVGEDCHFYPHVALRERSQVGARVILHPGVVLGADGFGYETKDGRHLKVPQTGYVQVDDDVEIGANSTIDRGRFGPTWIQEGVKIDNQVQIAHNCTIGKHVIIVAHCGIAGSTSIGDHAVLAAKVGIIGHLHIGEGAIVTAMSGVSKDIPAGAVYSGRRAIPKKTDLRNEANINKIGDLVKRVRALEKELAAARSQA
ncbi:MAG: UDP-3-O-(3-hydroxymyristoyl)glucosamine N-acyltransferase [Verrucomicrobiota bacterium]